MRFGGTESHRGSPEGPQVCLVNLVMAQPFARVSEKAGVWGLQC